MSPRVPRVIARSTAWLAAGTALTALTAVLWSEWVTWRASVDALPPTGLDRRPREGDAVLVLGFRSSATGRVNLIQRWRVRIAVRSVDPRTATFIFSGGAMRGDSSEAALMARHAITAHGVPADRVVLEEQSRTTWENIAFSIPLLRDARTIVIASNTFHARRARGYLSAQAPELADRLRRGADYRFGELLLVKPYLAVYEWRRSRLRSV